MRCPSCGTEVRPGQRFCMDCGATLRGVGDVTGEVPTIRATRQPSVGVREEVTRAMGPAPLDDPPLDDTLVMRPERPARDWQHDPHATVRMPRGQGSPAWTAPAQGATGWSARPQGITESTTQVAPARPAPDPTPTVTAPWAQDRRVEQPPDRHRPFRLRTMFFVAVIAAAATAVGALTDVISIRPGAAGAPFDVGTWMVNDFGTNNAVGGIVGAGVMLVGAFLWCFGFRWAAGLAGGAGAALAGWAALIIGLAEYPLFVAGEAATTSPAELTRAVGYWAVAGAGVLGLVVLACSLAGARGDGDGGLDPWVAALGAVSFVVAAGGPLIPMGSAELSANYSAETLGVDVPTIFFAGRLAQLGLLAVVGVVGFLLVRRWGLGLAIGSAVVAGWMVVTAATGQTDHPIGPGFANPGATAGADVQPHAVTIVGMALVGFFAVVAVGMALLGAQRRRSTPRAVPR